jgi:hypothetical protein
MAGTRTHPHMKFFSYFGNKGYKNGYFNFASVENICCILHGKW